MNQLWKASSCRRIGFLRLHVLCLMLVLFLGQHCHASEQAWTVYCVEAPLFDLLEERSDPDQSAIVRELPPEKELRIRGLVVDFEFDFVGNHDEEKNDSEIEHRVIVPDIDRFEKGWDLYFPEEMLKGGGPAEDAFCEETLKMAAFLRPWVDSQDVVVLLSGAELRKLIDQKLSRIEKSSRAMGGIFPAEPPQPFFMPDDKMVEKWLTIAKREVTILAVGFCFGEDGIEVSVRIPHAEDGELAKLVENRSSLTGAKPLFKGLPDEKFLILYAGQTSIILDSLASPFWEALISKGDMFKAFGQDFDKTLKKSQKSDERLRSNAIIFSIPLEGRGVVSGLHGLRNVGNAKKYMRQQDKIVEGSIVLAKPEVHADEIANDPSEIECRKITKQSIPLDFLQAAKGISEDQKKTIYLFYEFLYGSKEEFSHFSAPVDSSYVGWSLGTPEKVRLISEFYAKPPEHRGSLFENKRIRKTLEKFSDEAQWILLLDVDQYREMYLHLLRNVSRSQAETNGEDAMEDLFPPIPKGTPPFGLSLEIEEGMASVDLFVPASTRLYVNSWIEYVKLMFWEPI